MANALLQHVLDDPTDTAARLVYADWLTEHDDPRGLFISQHIAGHPGADALLAADGPLGPLDLPWP